MEYHYDFTTPVYVMMKCVEIQAWWDSKEVERGYRVEEYLPEMIRNVYTDLLFKTHSCKQLT